MKNEPEISYYRTIKGQRLMLSFSIDLKKEFIEHFSDFLYAEFSKIQDHVVFSQDSVYIQTYPFLSVFEADASKLIKVTELAWELDLDWCF